MGKTTTTVEAPRERRKLGASRQHWEPAPLLRLHPAAMESELYQVAARIVDTKRARSCGAFLLIDPGLQVYVISEERSVAEPWVLAHFGWLVGKYCPEHVYRFDCVETTLAGLVEDVHWHLLDLLKRAQANLDPLCQLGDDAE